MAELKRMKSEHFPKDNAKQLEKQMGQQLSFYFADHPKEWENFVKYFAKRTSAEGSVE